MLHHAAIVRSAKGTEVTLLNQNAPVGSPAVGVTFDLARMQPNTDGTKSFISHDAPGAKSYRKHKNSDRAAGEIRSAAVRR